MGWIKKKDLLKKINDVETSNKTLLKIIDGLNTRIKLLENTSADLDENVSKMREKVTYLWNQDQYKKEDMDSILDEWMNGAKEEGDD